MTGLKINEIKIGDKKRFSLVLTDKIHEDFRKISGDNSPIHTDNNFATKAGFKTKIAYGFNIAAFLSRFYGEILPGGSSICLQQELKFIKPVYPEERITIIGEVIGLNKNHKIVTIRNDIINSENELCVSGMGTVRIII